MFKSFNNPDTIGVISSYPARGGEIARDNAISRYTNLLVSSFPKDQKIVVFAEKRKSTDKPYLVSKNILVNPVYFVDDPFFFVQILKYVSNFSLINDFLIQFEFSIFGGKKVIPGFLVLLSALKLMGKNTSIVLHQVATDLNMLHGHLGLVKDSLKANLLSTLTRNFYSTVGVLVNKIMIHDEILKNRLMKFVAENKIAVIPHAVGDLYAPKSGKKFEQIARSYFDLNKNDKVVTVYGYRSWYKGTDFIVQAMSEISKKYPKKNIKLLIAGGVSPTLKNNWSYQIFDTKLKAEIKDANGSVRTSDFIPEKDVWKVFLASDLVVFPYRTRMSASGAFSLNLSYKKPFMVSKAFSEGLDLNIPGAIFNLDYADFEKKLLRFMTNKSLRMKTVEYGRKLASERSWERVSKMYILAIKNTIDSDVNFNLDKNYQLVQA